MSTSTERPPVALDEFIDALATLLAEDYQRAHAEPKDGDERTDRPASEEKPVDG
jgi:hypothetical protein